MGTTESDRRRHPASPAVPFLPLLALLGLLAGCASAGSSSGGGGWEVGRQWGCDPAEVRREYAEAHPEGSAPVEITPRSGWSACQMMALSGPPTEVERIEAPAGDTYHLYYRGGGRTRMVTLRRDVTGTWLVSAVVW